MAGESSNFVRPNGNMARAIWSILTSSVWMMLLTVISVATIIGLVGAYTVYHCAHVRNTARNVIPLIALPAFGIAAMACLVWKVERRLNDDGYFAGSPHTIKTGALILALVTGRVILPVVRAHFGSCSH